MNEKYVFEVREVRQKDNQWEIDGLAFNTIKIGDVLSITEQPEDHKVILSIKDIVTYKHHVEELVRGLTGRLTVQNDGEVDLAQVNYLYKVNLSH